MDEFNKILEQLINKITDIQTIDINDIPNIDLYMDQITTFMDNKLNCYKRYEEDKVLTKTMINNYAKAKIFPPPVKKKYSKNHVMLLIIIYHLKSILSISDINKLLTPITDELKANEYSKTLQLVYNSFVLLQRNNTYNVLSELTGKHELIDMAIEKAEIKNDKQIKFILTVLLLSIQANTEKRLAEKILDDYFK